MNKVLPTVWMYGGGRQSIRIALLILEGRLPLPHITCIADTGREKSTTWKYLAEVVQPAFPLPIHRVSKEKFATVDLYSGKSDMLLIPAWTNQSGKVSKLETFCSNEWKTRVCDRWLKKEMGIKHWVSWIGFSCDEPKRYNAKRRSMGDSVYFPLVDGVPQTKQECVDEVIKVGWPHPPGSSCWMCPLQDDDKWMQNTPEDQAQAIQFDRDIRQKDPNVFLHRSCVPLDQVKFDPRNESQEPCDSGVCFA